MCKVSSPGVCVWVLWGASLNEGVLPSAHIPEVICFPITPYSGIPHLLLPDDRAIRLGQDAFNPTVFHHSTWSMGNSHISHQARKLVLGCTYQPSTIFFNSSFPIQTGASSISKHPTQVGASLPFPSHSLYVTIPEQGSADFFCKGPKNKHFSTLWAIQFLLRVFNSTIVVRNVVAQLCQTLRPHEL